MDKSFNDQELSDIMKEIEALEDDFTTVEDKAATPVMEELAHMDESVSVPKETAKIVSLDTKRAAPKETSSNSTSMSFKVQGNLTLDLNFEIGGKTVTLEVSEEGLTIEMDGGMKFTVPVTEKAAIKKAV